MTAMDVVGDLVAVRTDVGIEGVGIADVSADVKVEEAFAGIGTADVAAA